MKTVLNSFLHHPLVLAALGLVVMFGAIAGVAQLVDSDLQQQSRLMNVSVRGPAGTGPESMLVGFVVSESSQTLVVRAQGPSLASNAGPNGLSAILLRVVRNADGVDVGRNDGWRGPGNERLLGDLKHLAPADARDAACVLTLAPGAYSALVEPKGGKQGLAGIEIFVVKR